MSTQDIGLLQALDAKMTYLNQRQKVLAQNIANGDTPGYRPREMKAVDFGSVLGSLTGDSTAKLQMTITNPMDLGSAAGNIVHATDQTQKKTYETSPDGNSVVMEEQMVKSTQNTMDYNLATSLYEKNIALLRTAIDAGH